jgi:hypothetical protein
MENSIIGLTAVVMSLGIPLGGMYTYYRVRKLRTEERLAAIARGAAIPAMEPELSHAARSRKAAILLVSGALGWILTFALIGQIERNPEVWVAAAIGIIPLAVGIGYFVDFTLNRNEPKTTG